jgi:hypothetical protein
MGHARPAWWSPLLHSFDNTVIRKLESMSKEVVAAYFRQYSGISRGTEENYEEPVPGSTF